MGDKSNKDRAAEGAFNLSTHELPRRAGEMREYQLDIQAPFRVGVPLIAVAEGELIELDVRCESVTEGVLVTADIYAVATGECIRCLDPVEQVIDRRVQELYRYEPTDDKGKRTRATDKGRDEEEGDLDEVDILYLEGVIANLEIPVLDAIILTLPINPLCDQDCLGLCPDCGEKWEQLPEDHRHEAVDARWAGLTGLDLGSADK